jgi:RNA polymerase sigma-70 factor, ECF subfamily
VESLRKPAVTPERFDQLYREHVEEVARWAARLGGADIDVDDVVQEVFVAVYKQLPKFRGESSVRTWLYRITANQVGERRRRDRWRRFFGGAVAEDLASPALTPVENLERREAQARVYRALDAMNDRYRTLVILFELEKLSGQQIAELLGMSLDSVWVTLHRARAQFKKRLEAQS